MDILEELETPKEVNYIGVFLTLDCNLDCSYCINDPGQTGRRRATFDDNHRTLSPGEWVRGLSRIQKSSDLPITLQGGEPILYAKGKGLGHILDRVEHHFDLLTNLTIPPEKLASAINHRQDRLRRDAPYPSVRVSYHPAEMERLWNGRGFVELVERCLALSDYGFNVSPDKITSDVGIYMLEHPDHKNVEHLRATAADKVPFETKEFLGRHDGRLYGTYLYPFSTDLVASGVHHRPLDCECRTSELLIDPLGFVWGCHFYLYESWKSGGPGRQFTALEAEKFRFAKHVDVLFGGDDLRPIGHILDPDFSLHTIRIFRHCPFYGRCVGCDTKLKNDRFQSLDDRNIPHTSVDIRNIRMPETVLAHIDDKDGVDRFLHPDTAP